MSNPMNFSISPAGELRDGAGIPFPDGQGAALLALLRTPVAPDESSATRYLRRLASAHVRRLAALGEPTAPDALQSLAARARPSEGEAAMLALGAPEMLGAEYWSAAPLLAALSALDGALAAAWTDSGRPFADFVRSLSPAWRNSGKVSFHLAENKGDAACSFPFAFLASFSHRDDTGSLRRYPLATALRLFASEPGALQSLLEPVRKAAEKSDLAAELLESRRIFRPCAWDAPTALRFLRDAPAFENAGIGVETAALWRGGRGAPRVKVRATLTPAAGGGISTRSLLNVSAVLCLDGEPLSKEEAEALFSGGGMVRIRGQWVVADPEKLRVLLERWKEAETLARREGVSLAEGLRLVAGADSGPLGELAADPDSEVAPGAALAEALRGLSDPATLPPPDLPPALEKTLRPYQKSGVRFLDAAARLGLGVCLADDMGLGKTLQALAFLVALKRVGALGSADSPPALLVAPATLLANWRAEAARFAPELRLRTLHPSALSPADWNAARADPAAAGRGADLMLTTYGMLARLPALAKAEWAAVVADEAQVAKNAGTRQSRALRALRAPRRVALTGTPVENRLSDLWSLFDFLDPGLLGSQKSFAELAKACGDDLAPVRRLVRPFLLRRLKTDKALLPDLPDKTERTVRCGLSRLQAELYAKCANDLARELEEPPAAEEGTAERHRRGLVLKYLPRFKQICNHPSQFRGDGEFAPSASGKFRALADLVSEIAARQERMLVFTQFREMTEPLRLFLRDLFGRDGLVLHGGTPVAERARLVRAFQTDGGPPFFVLSLKAAGTGLNLTAASHVVHFDRWWNPAVEDQASDRAYRIGQKRNVLVHKFVCAGTLEERIDEMIESKKALAAGLFSGGAEKLLSDMTAAELRALVALDPAAAAEE